MIYNNDIQIPARAQSEFMSHPHDSQQNINDPKFVSRKFAIY